MDQKKYSTHALNPRGVYTQLEDLIRLGFAAKDLNLFSNKRVATQLKGAQRTRFRGRGMDFEEVRLYQAGDDVRAIDWRVTARTQTPHTKLYQEERERPLFFLVDQRPSLFFGSQQCFKSVLAAHVLATLAWAGLKHSDRIGGMILGEKKLQEIKPRRSRKALLEMLYQTNELNGLLKTPLVHTQEVSLSESLERARALLKPGSSLFVISDFHDFNPACEQDLIGLAKHADIQLIHLYDPLEEKFDLKKQNTKHTSRLYVTNGIEKLSIDSHQTKLQENISQIFQIRKNRLEAFSMQYALPLISIATTESLQDKLRQIYAC